MVGPQARDKDKEVQACERHFNYSIYGIEALSMFSGILIPKLADLQTTRNGNGLEGMGGWVGSEISCPRRSERTGT